MTLRTRLAKLEAKSAPALEWPRAIIFTMVWRGEDGALMTTAHFAKVKTENGWEIVHPIEGEAEDVFKMRAEALANDSCGKTGHFHANINHHKTQRHSL